MDRQARRGNMPSTTRITREWRYDYSRHPSQVNLSCILPSSVLHDTRSDDFFISDTRSIRAIWFARIPTILARARKDPMIQLTRVEQVFFRKVFHAPYHHTEATVYEKS
jgi:hypothetical protein